MTQTTAPETGAESAVAKVESVKMDAEIARLMGAPIAPGRMRKTLFQSLLQARTRYGGKSIAVFVADGR